MFIWEVAKEALIQQRTNDTMFYSGSNNKVAVRRPVVKWCRMSNYRSRNSHMEPPASF